METSENNKNGEENKNEKKSYFFDQGVKSNNKFLNFFTDSPLGIFGIPIAIIVIGVIIYALLG